MKEKIKKLIDLINSKRLKIDLKEFGECKIIDIAEDNEGNEIGITVSYTEDFGGYGNEEEIIEDITWGDLFNQEFRLYTEQVTTELIEL